MRGKLGTIIGLVVVMCASVQAVADSDVHVRKKLRALRAYALTDALNLDEVSAAKLFPALARFDSESDTIAMRRAEVQRKLAAVTPQTDRKTIDTLVEQFTANVRWQRDLEDRRLAELRKLLTPTQVAHLVLVLPEFDVQLYPLHGNVGDDDDPDAPMPSTATMKPGSKRSSDCDPFNDRIGCR